MYLLREKDAGVVFDMKNSEQEIEFKREVKFIPTYDDSLTIRFFLHGQKGIIHFSIRTGWKQGRQYEETGLSAYGSDVGYHSPHPMYEGQNPVDKCDFFEPCYYDGSSSQAEEYFNSLLEFGDEYIWSKLEATYRSRFLDEK